MTTEFENIKMNPEIPLKDKTFDNLKLDKYKQTIKMNPIIKEKWINSLLSGDYKQATKALCRLDENGNKSYCCLGVLTDLYQKECETNSNLTKLIEDNERLCIIYKDSENIDNFSSSRLLDKVYKWSGIVSELGYYDNEKALSIDNDSGKTFLEIAEIIKEKF